MCGKRERTKEGGERGGEGGRDDDGTGVEFTHPAGSDHYWHIYFSMMSHPSNGGSERHKPAEMRNKKSFHTALLFLSHSGFEF